MVTRTARGADGTCRTCAHFIDDPARLENALPGLHILSSAWGSTRGDAGICAAHGTWQDPVPRCPEFRATAGCAFPEGAAHVTKR